MKTPAIDAALRVLKLRLRLKGGEGTRDQNQHQQQQQQDEEEDETEPPPPPPTPPSRRPLFHGLASLAREKALAAGAGVLVSKPPHTRTMQEGEKPRALPPTVKKRETTTSAPSKPIVIKRTRVACVARLGKLHLANLFHERQTKRLFLREWLRLCQGAIQNNNIDTI